MDKGNIKKLMLLKKEKGEAVVRGNGVDAEKNALIRDVKDGTCSTGKGAVKDAMEAGTVHLFRVLAVDDDRVLLIDCIKKTMPVWIDMEQMDVFAEMGGNGVEFPSQDDSLPAQDKESLQQHDYDALENLSPDIRKIVYQRYNIISAILPFVADEAMRSRMIAKMAEEHGISKQSVRKYLCEYLASQDIRSLAPQERNVERDSCRKCFLQHQQCAEWSTYPRRSLLLHCLLRRKGNRTDLWHDSFQSRYQTERSSYRQACQRHSYHLAPPIRLHRYTKVFHFREESNRYLNRCRIRDREDKLTCSY